MKTKSIIRILLQNTLHFLSGKSATFLICIAVICARGIQLLYFSYLGGDRAHQALASQNFIYGHGISIAHVLPGNLSEIIYEPLTKWPPGYSLLLSPFYTVFGGNHIAAGFVLDFLFAILFVIVTRGILRTLNLTEQLINIFTILTGFTIYSFYKQPYADAIAITLFLSGIYLSLQSFKTDRLQYIYSFLISICLILAAYSKYLYMPVIFIIPIYLIVRGYIDRSVIRKKAGLLCLFLCGLALASLLVYQKIVSGSSVYITEPTRGFFPENILVSYPAIPAALISPETLGLGFGKRYDPGTILYQTLQWAHLLTGIYFLIIGIRLFWKKKSLPLTEVGTFFQLSFLTCLGIAAVLTILSLIVAKEITFWTYVQEARYYGLFIVLLQLILFVKISKIKHRWNQQMLVLIITFLMLPEMTRGLIFTSKRLIRINKEEYTWQTEYKIQQFAENIIKREKENKNVVRVVLTGSSDYMNNRICLNSHIPILANASVLNDLSVLKAKEPTLLLISIRQDALSAYHNFLADTRKELAGTINGFYFYTVYVTTH